ncbi:hypothetical protein EP7_001196 [Isosphaeraceae bacterium EP7]
MLDFSTLARRPLLSRLLALTSMTLAFLWVMAFLVVLFNLLQMPTAFTPTGVWISGWLRLLAGADPQLFLVLRGPLAILLFLAGTATAWGDPRGRLMHQAWAWFNLGVFAFGLMFAIRWLPADWLSAVYSLTVILVLEHPALVADFEQLSLAKAERSRRMTEHLEPDDEFSWEDPL